MTPPAPAAAPEPSTLAGGPRRPLAVLRAGTVPYARGLELQAELVAERRDGETADTLVVLEHPHVITLGRGADKADVLTSDDERARLGIDLFEAGRGGGVTYHGPGQLVAYPIIDLKPDRKDLHAYLRDLETVLIETAAAFGVPARRRAGLTGVWTDRGKLAAVGVRVSSQWITSHGVALNVAPDLAYFDSIVPCGLVGEAVTSLEREVGGPVDPEQAVSAFVRCFASAFDCEVVVA
jgi:lipoate-protein ligase B